MEQLQMILGAIEASEKRITQQIDTKIAESETRTRVFIENEVVGELHSLFDGYRLTHEKQWEMERETERLKRKVDDLQTRMEVLESKVSS